MSEVPSSGDAIVPTEAAPQGRRVRGRKNKKTRAASGASDKVDTDPIAGARDYLPDDMRLRKWLFAKWHETARIFAFEAYDAPILEPMSLYRRKSGVEICDQMYCFEDKSGQEIGLRPEMTPSLARLVVKAGRSLPFPIKWYSIPQCWRWETTARGRKRAFFQWNMDILGVAGVAAEAELIASIVWFCEQCGLTARDVVVRVSNRKLLDTFMQSLALPDASSFVAICSCIDKFDTADRAATLKKLVDAAVPAASAERIMAFVESSTLAAFDAMAVDNEAMQKAIKEIRDMMDLLECYGCREWVTFDASIVRGLAYYTGIVFEVFAKRGQLVRAIAGGGRYDTLLQAYGDQRRIPAVGYGLGDCVILEVLKEKGLLPSMRRAVQDVVIPFNARLMGAAVSVATQLRKKGRVVDIVLKRLRKVRQAFSYADRVNAERAIFVAPTEWAQGQVKVKMMRVPADADQAEKEMVVALTDL